jgi:hypothetical protein
MREFVRDLICALLDGFEDRLPVSKYIASAVAGYLLLFLVTLLIYGFAGVLVMALATLVPLSVFLLLYGLVKLMIHYGQRPEWRERDCDCE